MCVLSIRDIGPLLVRVECAGRMGTGPYLDVVIGHIVMVVWVIDRL